MPIESNNPIITKHRINPVALYLMALAIVIGAYSGYLQFAVPAIEGPANLVKKLPVHTPLDELPSPREEKSDLLQLLPDDAWELTACKTLLIDAGTILFKDLDQQEDGSLLIKPFTLITGLENGSSASPTGAASKPPTVLRCLSGAKLKFNKPLRNLFTGKAKMESARLAGRVDIYRPPSAPQQNDAVYIVTSNVQIEKNRIYTLEKVQFEFGSNQGSGRNMLIDLTHEDESAALIDFSSINGIRRLELAFLTKLRVESSSKNQVRNDESSNGNLANQPESNHSKSLFSNNNSPLEITCKGPFVFDFESKTASFRKQVVAQQVDAFKDNIRCDELTLVFEDKPGSGQPSDPELIRPILPDDPSSKGIDADMKIQRFIAKGSPAIVLSRSRSAKISGEYLSYNILTNRIDASCDQTSNKMVTINSTEYQLVAKQLTYQLSDDGSLGEIDAIGPGRLLRVGNPDRDDFYSTWKNSLTTRKVPQNPGLLRVVVDGSAEIRVADQTSINADRLEMTVWQIPKLVTDANRKVTRSWEHQPAKLFTSGDVTIVSPKLDGQADHLTATWAAPQNLPPRTAVQSVYRAGYRGTFQFRTNQTGRPSNMPQQLATIPRGSGAFQTHTTFAPQAGSNEPIDSTKQTGFVEQTGRVQQTVVRDPNVRTVGFAQEKPQPKTPQRKLKFKGENVDIRLTGTGDAIDIRDLTIEGNVTIVSTPIITAGVRPAIAEKQRPLTINCHRLQLTPQSAEENYRTLISGKDGGLASVASETFDLTGQHINLDQAANKVWVEGIGTMKMKTDGQNEPSPRKLTSQIGGSIKRMAMPQALDVSWTGGMIFDGTKIYFEHSVEMSVDRIDDEGNRSNTRSRSDGLRVDLTKPVKFQSLQSDEKVDNPEIRELIFVDHVPEAKQRFKLVKHSAHTEQPAKRPVVIENKSYDAKGVLSEQQRITVPQAIVNPQSGSIESRGPGTISTHRLSKPSTDSSPDPFGRLAGQGKAQNKSGVTFLQINFDGQLSVRAKQKEMRIDGNLRTIYSPVPNWDVSFNPDDIQDRTPGTVFMTCDKLLMAQWTPRGEEKDTSEFIATGNTHIFSNTFRSNSDRVSFDQSTDVLTIKGTPRVDADLLFKLSPNDKEPKHLVANEITYRIRDQATKTIGVKTFQ